jgi:hypothetical protein
MFVLMILGTIKIEKIKEIIMSSNYGQLLKDLQIGFEEGEKPVQEFIKSTFGMLTDNVGSNTAGWDLEVGGVDEDFLAGCKKPINPQILEKKFKNRYGSTIEVKRDKTSDRTGNFFYEVWSNQKANNPGCMAVSKADTLVIVRSTEFLFINRSYFISWVVYNLYHDTSLSRKWKRSTCGETRNPEMKSTFVSPNVRGILIPIVDIKEFSCIDIFERSKNV